MSCKLPLKLLKNCSLYFDYAVTAPSQNYRQILSNEAPIPIKSHQSSKRFSGNFSRPTTASLPPGHTHRWFLRNRDTRNCACAASIINRRKQRQSDVLCALLTLHCIVVSRNDFTPTRNTADSSTHGSNQGNQILERTRR